MEDRINRKLAYVDMLANNDDVYQSMLFRLRELEKQFDAIISRLPEQEQDLAWDFVMLCEDMSLQKLRLACRCMCDCGNTP